MRVRRLVGVAIITTVGTTLAACAQRSMEVESTGAVITTPSLATMIAGWPAKSREAATFATNKYGMPTESTPTMLVWRHGSGPLTHTIVYRDEVPHAFPMAHVDVMEQFVDYRVPVELYDDLARYDGSVIAERTKGVLSARCDKEAMNFLAINLAHDIVTGKRSVEDARKMYAEQAMAFMKGQTSSYTTGLTFTPTRGNTGDPDQPAMSGM